MIDNDYIEIDPSPMATLQKRFIADLEAIQAKATYWEVYCTIPLAPDIVKFTKTDDPESEYHSSKRRINYYVTSLTRRRCLIFLSL